MANVFTKMRAALTSFQKYMPSALVKNLMLSGKIAEVGGNHKTLTLLFSDIEDFASIAEKMSPDELMYYLSSYFEVATKIIINNGGTIDKYIGDGILAFWGAPIDQNDHALYCCRTALALQEAFGKLNAEWRLGGKPEIKTRIGISTGEVVVGNVGSEDRLNYTVLGDHVNLASRLELLNKTYGTYILVSDSTYNVVKDFFKFRLIDKVRVKGKNHSVKIYELLNYSYVLSEYDRLFNEAFVKYERGDWQDALGIFIVLESKYPKDKLVKIFVDRCVLFIKTPPPFWNGEWVMGEK